MKNLFAFMAPALFALMASASTGTSNLNVTQLITSNSKIMAAVDAKIKMILPKVNMKFSGIEVNSSETQFSAVMTYVDTAHGTFFHPNFGRCSVLVRGKIIDSSSVTVTSIVEDNCGE